MRAMKYRDAVPRGLIGEVFSLPGGLGSWVKAGWVALRTLVIVLGCLIWSAGSLTVRAEGNVLAEWPRLNRPTWINGDGAVYSMVVEGGNLGGGAVTRSQDGGVSWTVVHAFDPDRASRPSGAPVEGMDGYLYGATDLGQRIYVDEVILGETVRVPRYMPGVFYRIGANGTGFQVLGQIPGGLQSEEALRGSGLVGGLLETTLDSAPNGQPVMLGVLRSGGENGAACVVSVAMDGTGVAVVGSFEDGERPSGGLVADPVEPGVHHGVTANGSGGGGRLYEVRPRPDMQPMISTVHSFGASMTSPVYAPVWEVSGRMLVLMESGGTANRGGIIRLNFGDGAVTEQILTAFTTAQGAPAGPMTFSEDGGIYLATRGAGTSMNSGSILQVQAGTGRATEVRLFSSTGATQANPLPLYPRGRIVRRSDGDLLGTFLSRTDGVSAGGMFRLTPSWRLENRYEVRTTTATWTNSQATAVSLDGHLVTVSSLGEYDVMLSQLGTALTQGGSIWIGAYAEPGRGNAATSWKWVTGEPWSYTRWSAGEPNNSGNNEHHAHFLNSGSSWNDMAANELHRSLVEYEDQSRIPFNVSLTMVQPLPGQWATMMEGGSLPVFGGVSQGLGGYRGMFRPNRLPVALSLYSETSMAGRTMEVRFTSDDAGEVPSGGMELTLHGLAPAGVTMSAIPGHGDSGIRVEFGAGSTGRSLQDVLYRLVARSKPGASEKLHTRVTISEGERLLASVVETQQVQLRDLSPTLADPGRRKVVLQPGSWQPEAGSLPMEVPLDAADDLTPLGELVVTAVADNLTLVPQQGGLVLVAPADGLGWRLRIQPAAQVTGVARIEVLVRDGGGNSVSATFEFEVEAAPRITSLTIPSVVATGSPLRLEVEAQGSGSLSYQWYRDGEAIAGATSPVYEVGSAGSAQTGRYKIAVSNASGSLLSEPSLLEVMAVPAIASVSSNVWVAAGQPFALTGTWSSAGATTVRWRKDGVDVVANGGTHTVQQSGVGDEGWYRFEVQNPVGTIVSVPVFVRVTFPGHGVFGWGPNSAGETVFGADWNEVADLVAGAEFTLGLTTSGTVLRAGRLPAPPAWAGKVVSMAAGRRHAVVLLENGTVRAWGEEAGQASVQIPQGLAGVVQVAAGDDYSAVLLSSGEVIVFGGGPSTALGSVQVQQQGVRAELAALNLRPVQTVPIRFLAAGPRVLGAVDREGRLALLAGSVTGLTPFPFSQPPQDLTPIRHLTIGDRHAVVAGGVDQGGIQVWGNNSHGQLQIPAGFPDRIASARAGFHHTLVLGGDRRISAWGAGSDPAASEWPNLGQSVVPEGIIAHRIAAGWQHSVALGRRPVPPAITRQPDTIRALDGSEAVLEVVATGDPVLGFQWQRRQPTGEWSDIGGAISAALTIPVIRSADDGAYRVVISNPYGQVTSSEVMLQVLVAPALPPDHSVASITQGTGGGDILLEAPAVGGSGPFEYQWFLDGELIQGANARQFPAAPNAGSAGLYRVRVTGPGGESTFDVARVRIIALPVIVRAPAGASAVVGETEVFEVVAEGEGLSEYRWYRLDGNGDRIRLADREGLVIGANRMTFQSAAMADAGRYEVEVVGLGGVVRSADFQFRVIEPPQVVGQPVLQRLQGETWSEVDPGQPVAVGSELRLVVDVVGSAPLTYEWFHQQKRVLGADGPVFRLSGIDSEGSQQGAYHVRISNEAGQSRAVESAELTLVTQTPPRILSVDDRARLLEPGDTLELVVLAVGHGLTFQWKRDGEGVAGADSPQLSLANMQAGEAGNYSLEVSNSWGSVETRPISVQVAGTPPVIASLSYSAGGGAPVVVEGAIELTLPPGTALSMSLDVAGPGVAVVWYRDGSVIPGAAGVGLNVNALGDADFGEYWATAASIGGLSTSGRLLVRPAKPPALTVQPRDLNVTVGQDVTLEIAVESDPASGEVTYQWYQNSVAIPEATGPILDRIIIPSSTVQAGSVVIETDGKWYRPTEGGMQFYVEVTNAGGRIRSGVSTVFVVDDFGQLSASGDTNAIQTVVLKPGWNAFHLKVQPGSRALATVLQGVPWSSVWRYQNRRNAVQFIEDVSEGDWQNPNWLVGFSPLTPEGDPNPLVFAGNLKLFTRDHAYLIRIHGTNDHTLYLHGSVGVGNAPWVSDSYNLRGFAVDPATTGGVVASESGSIATSPASAGLTLEKLIGHDRALWDGTERQPWGVYRLNSSGVWEKMLPGAMVNANEAYWVFARGAVQSPAPLSVELDFGDALIFDSNVDTRQITVSNPSAQTREVRLSLGPLGRVAVPAATEGEDEENYVAPEQPEDGEALPSGLGLQSPLFLSAATDNGFELVPFEENGRFSLGPGESRTLQLNVKRSMVPVEGWENTLLVSDGMISENVAVRVDPRRTFGGSVNGSPTAPASRRSAATAASQAVSDMKGLWMGRIRVDGVSQVNGYEIIRTPRTFVNADGVRTNVVEISYRSREGETEPTVTPAAMDVEMLVHYDGVNVRLVSEVFFMREPGAGDAPGNFVLFCNRALMGRYEGVQTRDREQVGRRVSSIAFPLPAADRARGFTPVTGQFKPGSRLSVSLSMDANDPLNPFRHRYHPDHDNLSANFRVYQPEAYSFRRNITLQLSGGIPTQDSRMGTELMEGTFVEKIHHLHRNPIVLKGKVEWLRISTIENLLFN